jgi:peptide/nickel transport system substrate-binding protein
MGATKKFLIFLTILILVCSTFVPQVFSQEKKILRMAVKNSDIRSMDPHTGNTTVDLVCADVVFNALIRFPKGTVTMNVREAEGDLAERWNVSSDGLVWTFYLRKGVKFHKGYGELTAEDVKFSLEKSADPKMSAYSGEYQMVDKIEALDKYTVRITLKHGIPSIMVPLGNFHGGFIVSKKAVLEKGDNFKFDPIGTGPFMFESYKPKEKAVYLKNPDYYEGKPIIDVLELWLMPEDASREMAFKAGDLDIIEGMREKVWVDKMKSVPGTLVDIFGPGEFGVLYLHKDKKPFDDIRVRKAMNFGINQEEVAAFMGKGLAVPMISPVAPTFWGYSDKVPRYPFDPKKAKQLLKEAGYPKGFSLDMVMTESTDYRRPMEQVQAQLRRIGIDLKLNIVSHSTFHERIRKDVNNMDYYSALGVPIANAVFQRFWLSRSIFGKPTAQLNFAKFELADKEIDMGEKEPDVNKKLAYWAEAQKKIMEDAACKPVILVKFSFARKSYVKLGYPELKDSLTVCPQITHKTDIVK